jgi:PilZ domain
MNDRSTDRRGAPRFEAVEEHGIVSASVRPGHRARLIDVSAGGALIETNHRLMPGKSMELQVEKEADRASIGGKVLRCVVVKLHPTWVCYRAAILFDKQLSWLVGKRAPAAGTERQTSNQSEAGA